jgi:large subunit ribosomal protein L2
MIDFFFTDKKGIEAKVKTIEYDPYRTGWIALIAYKDGEKRYVLAHKDMKV